MKLPTLFPKYQHLSVYVKYQYLTRENGKVLDVMNLAGEIFNDCYELDEDAPPVSPLMGVRERDGCLLRFRIKTKVKLEPLAIYSVNAAEKTLDSVIMCDPVEIDDDDLQLAAVRKHLTVVPFELFQKAITEALQELMTAVFAIDDSIVLTLRGDPHWIQPDSELDKIMYKAEEKGVPDALKHCFTDEGSDAETEGGVAR